MSTIQNTEGVIGAEIHPEIPMPGWATDRYLDDDGREVCDEHNYDDSGFDVELARMHSFGNETVRRHDDNVMITWRSVWADGTGVDREQFTILVPDIPKLVAVLQRAQAKITEVN